MTFMMKCLQMSQMESILFTLEDSDFMCIVKICKVPMIMISTYDRISNGGLFEIQSV